MKKKLSPWSKEIKKKMIDQDLNSTDLAELMNWTRQYTSSIINGNVSHQEAITRISNFFNISAPEDPKATLAKE